VPVNLPEVRSGQTPSRSHGVRTDPAALGPQVGFFASIVAVIAVWGLSRASLPADLVMPLVATSLLVLAAAFGLAAWRRRMDPNGVTYRDVAGALTLIGLCAAATIEPEQMVRIVQNSAAG
jgi:hypothetical protein